MRTIRISIDGNVATHDSFRRTCGSYKKALNAVYLLKQSGYFDSVQVITVVTPDNIHKLSELYNVLLDVDVDSWKLTGVEPILKRNAFCKN